MQASKINPEGPSHLRPSHYDIDTETSQFYFASIFLTTGLTL